MSANRPGRLWLPVLAAAFLSACATTAPPPEERDPADPWEPFNRNMYQVNRTLDKAVLRPLARGYDRITPEPVQRGIGNFFTNLRYIPTIFNLVLQGRPGDAGQALERLFVNTTVGVLGIFDVATRLEMENYREDFGKTLAHWGWRESRYLVLPFFGPSTLRDGLGEPVDFYTNPVWRLAVDGRYYVPALNVIHSRARLLPQEAALEEAFDEYLFLRDAWLQNRRYQILGEEAPTPDYDAFLDDDWNDWDD